MVEFGNGKVVGFVVVLVLVFVPPYVVRGVEPFFFGVPAWAWLAFIIHLVLLVVVVKWTDTLDLTPNQNRGDM